MNSFSVLFELKLQLLRNAVSRLLKKSPAEFLTLIVFFAAAGYGLFLFFFKSFLFFNGQEPFGPILISESFYLLNAALFTMLLISSAVSAYASLFQAREVNFLVVRPFQWTDIYFMKLLETLWYSSWSILFLTIPFMTAFGMIKHTVQIWFPIYCFTFYLPFAFLTCALGSLSAVICVWLLPGKNHRRFAFVLLIAAASFWLHQHQPDLIKEQGSLAGIMMGYLPNIAYAKNPFLPSYWLTKGILNAAALEKGLPFQAKDGIFYLLVLISNTLFFLIPSYWAACRLYPKTFLKAQDHAETSASSRVFLGRIFEKLFDLAPARLRPSAAFFEKDLKTFSRNPSEWSQLLIFFGLLLFYFINLRNLQFHVLQSFWKQLVFALNTTGTYVVLSSFSMRVIFPMLSLEGTRSWIIGIAPIRFSSLLVEKFLLGMTASTVLTLPLIYLSGWMLEIPHPQILLTVVLGFFVCIALTGLSVGLGAQFINFKTTNPTEIISGFGGSMLLITHLTYLAAVGAFLAFSRESHTVSFISMAAGSLLTGFAPLYLGARTMNRMEF